MEFYSATKNEILSLTSKWMEMENIILSEVSQAQKAKNHIFCSYADCRPKICSTIGYGSHTRVRPRMVGIGKRKKTKNLNVVDVLTLEERTY
jgi:hypothetical protein